MNIRKTLLEMTVIVLSAAALGLFYNFFAAPKPLAWVYVPRPVDMASDSALFAPSKPKQDTARQATAAATSPLPAVSLNGAEPKPTEIAGNGQSPAAANKTAPQTSSTPAQNTPPKTQNAPPAAKALEVKYEQVLRLTKDPDVLFLDARKEHEFEEGHIPGAKSLSVLEFEKHVPEIIGLPRDKRIVVYCGGGLCELSHDLANNLIAFGFTRVFIYLGGYEDWKQQQKN